MQVSTGRIFESKFAALAVGVPAGDLVQLYGTTEQINSVSRAVQAGRASERKKAARRAAQRSRRNNR